MVLGFFALLAGVHPYRFHEWHMAMYLDAIDWASLPNTLGMSQFGDGGLIRPKSYFKSVNYIKKMRNYLKYCRFDHRQAGGVSACLITTFYRDFLDRYFEAFSNNHRMMVFQIKNPKKKRGDTSFMSAARQQAHQLKQCIEQQDYL